MTFGFPDRHIYKIPLWINFNLCIGMHKDNFSVFRYRDLFSLILFSVGGGGVLHSEPWSECLKAMCRINQGPCFKMISVHQVWSEAWESASRWCCCYRAENHILQTRLSSVTCSYSSAVFKTNLGLSCLSKYVFGKFKEYLKQIIWMDKIQMLYLDVELI